MWTRIQHLKQSSLLCSSHKWNFTVNYTGLCLIQFVCYLSKTLQDFLFFMDLCRWVRWKKILCDKILTKIIILISQKKKKKKDKHPNGNILAELLDLLNKCPAIFCKSPTSWNKMFLKNSKNILIITISFQKLVHTMYLKHVAWLT